MKTTTRKGLPLPEATDVYSVNYPVGPPGRTFNITGIVRDTDNAQSNILDAMTEFNQNEQISGSWEFLNSILADKGMSFMAVNNTGAARVSGDVVMIDPATDTSIILPNANSVDASKVLVCAENIATGAIGRVTMIGVIRLKVQGGTARGQYLQTVSGQVAAQGSATVTPGSFGFSLTAPDVSNTVLAMVHAGGAGGGLEVREIDMAPDVIGARVLQFPNGSLTDLGSQVVQLTFLPTLEVAELDGAPDVTAVAKLQVPNGSLTNVGGGTVALNFLPTLEVLEADGAPDVTAVGKLQFPNGSLTNAGGGQVNVAFPAAFALTVKDVQGATSVVPVSTIQFPNGSVTNVGGGTAGIAFGSTIMRRDQFLNQTGTTVTLSMAADSVVSVSKNGLEERAGTDYTVAGTTITFTTALANDDISVIYLQTNQFAQASAPYFQEFNPNVNDTTVTLMNTPGMILSVVRNGVTQSTQLGDWVWNSGTATIIFSDAFVAGEHVIVTWAQNFGGGNAATVNNIPAVPASTPQANALVAVDGTAHLPLAIMPTSTVFHEEYVPANAATTVTLSQTPQQIASVFRDGVLQSAQDGHYTLASNVLTFSDAFDGLSRVVVNYLFGTVLGDANTVKGFGASSAASPQPGTLVATDPTSGILPISVIPVVARANQLTNGGFELWQRGNGPYSTNGGYGPDRWSISTQGSSTLSVTKDTTNVDIGSNACAACVAGTATGASLFQDLKNVDIYQLRGRTICATGRVRSAVAGANVFMATDGASPASSTSPNQTGSGTYQTLAAPAMVVPNDATYVRIYITFPASGTHYVDNVMVTIGPDPVPYVPLVPADELARCLRYCQRLTNGAFLVGQCSSIGGYFLASFPARFGGSPSLTISATGDFSLWNAATTAIAATSGPTIYAGGGGSFDRLMISAGASGLVAGNATWLTSANSNASMLFEFNP